MFKIFLIVVGSLIGLWLGAMGVGKLTEWYNAKLAPRIKKWKLDHKPPTEEELKKQKEDAFKNELVKKYHELCFSLLKRHAIALKVSKEIQDNINKCMDEAKRCKILYTSTKNEEFKNKSLIFLQEAENSKALLKLANETITICNNKLQTVNLEYNAIRSKIINKKFECALLDSKIEGQSANTTYSIADLDSLLQDYNKKLESKRIDSEAMDQYMSEQKKAASMLALETGNVSGEGFDLASLTKELEKEFNKL